MSVGNLFNEENCIEINKYFRRPSTGARSIIQIFSSVFIYSTNGRAILENHIQTRSPCSARRISFRHPAKQRGFQVERKGRCITGKNIMSSSVYLFPLFPTTAFVLSESETFTLRIFDGRLRENKKLTIYLRISVRF